MSITQLKETAPFDILPEKILLQLRDSALQQTFPADTYIFKQKDEPTDFLYVIQEGMVEITAAVPGGQEMVVDYRKEGNFFGGTPIFSGQPYTGGARAVTATSCFLIPREVLTSVSNDYPQIREFFTKVILTRVRSLYADMVKENTSNALTQMEAYPFKKRLSEIMQSPVETCIEETPVRQVARTITHKKIGALIVVNAKGTPIGIISQRDLVAKVLAPDTADCENAQAKDVMTPHCHAMRPATYMYEAMTYMTAHKVKHLPIVDDGELVGIVTLHDLMRFRSQKAMLLVGSIRDENSLAGLARIKHEILTIARALLTETHSTPEVMEILSYIHQNLIKKTYAICYQQMLDEGHQPPSIRHAFLLMGSGGRREMLTSPDQDHGFVFENVSPQQLAKAEAFFIPFAEKLVTAFQEVGFPLCEGQVMVNNPAWRGRLDDWRERIHDWINDPEPQKVRYSSIFFDFVCLEGDQALADELQQIVFSEVREFKRFLYHMMTLDQTYRVPIGMLGRFLLEKEGTHKGQLSLKQGGIIYIVDCIRMFSLEQETPETSTLKRLEALTRNHIFERETAEHIKAAFEALTFLRLRNEIGLLDQGQEPGHYLDPNELTKGEQELLKESFNAVSKLQDATKRHFSKSFI
ncbi:putative nucleotidyltransferase substrate binding domain-containing protein [Geopsychrobacter electrodiphilus]|uniref:putative nucleotidyltransferase substrate binding domain-containing protein n=1 Tax=Geopsychrobacter electrodiphilus TaxID=225196 RepID=UPI000366A0A8|nr:putative nucleotidyltransferase substrate binding domain-containing protein [Geopsychrobacter electrodiphilus]